MRWAKRKDFIRGLGYAEHQSRSYDAVLRIYGDGGNVIEPQEHKDDFREF